MKTTIQENDKAVLGEIRVNKALNKYSSVVLFPEKLAKAKEAFEKFGLPKVDKQSR